MIRTLAVGLSLGAIFLAVPLLWGAGSGAMKIGVVDVERVIREVDEGRKAVAALQAERDAKKSQLDQIGANLERLGMEVQRLGEELELQGEMMRPEVRERKERELREKGTEFQRKQLETQQMYLKLQQELSDSELETISRLKDKLFLLAEEVAEKEKFDLILVKNGVVYSHSGTDITNRLKLMYNVRYGDGRSGGGGRDQE
jgi:outer membrane protein